MLESYHTQKVSDAKSRLASTIVEIAEMRRFRDETSSMITNYADSLNQCEKKRANLCVGYLVENTPERKQRDSQIAELDELIKAIVFTKQSAHNHMLNCEANLLRLSNRLDKLVENDCHL